MYEFRVVVLICSMFRVLSTKYILIPTVISSLTHRLFRRCFVLAFNVQGFSGSLFVLDF